MRAMKNSRCLVVLAILMLMFGASTAWAQFDTGTIAGSVTDPSGAVIPNATVTVTNTGTNVSKTVQTDNGGNFTASALPFGNYVVAATATGFGQAKSQPITLNVGATVHVHLPMTVAASEQNITVTGTPTAVNTASATSGTTLNSNEIANLPINGRDVSNFLEIAPGSVASTGFFQGSINGLDNIFSGLNVTVDGQNATRGDINGFLNTEGQEGARVTRASVDSVQEINFTNNGYSAEYGHSLGPQMNIVTKSGTNAYHGTIYEFFRNDALDARDFFDTNPKKQPLRLNQFGANLSGPLVKDKLFFFVNYEGDRTTVTSILPTYHVPSAVVRDAMVPSMAPVLAQMAPLPAGCTGNPPPASCQFQGNPNLVIDPAALPTTVREDTGSIRLDYNITDRDRLMFRYNINDSLTNFTYGLNQGQVSPQGLRTQLLKLDYTRTLSATLLNEFSVAIDRFFSNTNSNTPTPLVGFNGFFTDLGALPAPNSFNQVTPFTVFEIFDTVTKSAGNHNLKFGTQIRVNRLNTWLRPQQTFDYASFSDFENNAPLVLQKIGFPGFLGIRNSNWDFYVQDDWRVTRTLTINLGLRYDYNTVWSEQHGRMQNFDFATQSFLPAGAAAYEAPKHDFAPRVGFAWDPFGRGKTVIHGYGGLFYMPMQMGFGLTTNVPEFSNYNIIFPPPFPTPNPPLPPGTQNVTIFPQNPRDPYSTNWMFGVQQEVFKDTVLTVNYIGNKTQHMQAGVSYAAINLNPQNPNFFVPPPHAGFANENFQSDKLSSTYNALQTQLRSNLGSKLNVQVNYTWSHEIDNLVNVFSNWSDPFNINLDRSSGDWDVRHNFTASAVYNLPDMKDRSALERGFLGGWQTSNIFQVRSGLPTNITLVSGFFGIPMRPDSVSGQSPLVSNPSWPNSSFNLAAFQVPAGWNGVWGDPSTIGDVGRNSLRGPGFFQWDMSMMKNFGITEGSKLQFRVDFFNILNHPNFANPDGGICSSLNIFFGCTPNTPNPALHTGFGVVNETVAGVSGGATGNGTSRQVQLALKFIF